MHAIVCCVVLRTSIPLDPLNHHVCLSLCIPSHNLLFHAHLKYNIHIQLHSPCFYWSTEFKISLVDSSVPASCTFRTGLDDGVDHCQNHQTYLAWAEKLSSNQSTNKHVFGRGGGGTKKECNPTLQPELSQINLCVHPSISNLDYQLCTFVKPSVCEGRPWSCRSNTPGPCWPKSYHCSTFDHTLDNGTLQTPFQALGAGLSVKRTRSIKEPFTYTCVPPTFSESLLLYHKYSVCTVQ